MGPSGDDMDASRAALAALFRRAAARCDSACISERALDYGVLVAVTECSALRRLEIVANDGDDGDSKDIDWTHVLEVTVDVMRGTTLRYAVLPPRLIALLADASPTSRPPSYDRMPRAHPPSA